MELDHSFISFIIAYDNYQLHMNNLIHCVISLFNSTKIYDYDIANEEYERFVTLIISNELHGTSDLCDPIHHIYNTFIKPNL